jgi:hypothetical protein
MTRPRPAALLRTAALARRTASAGAAEVSVSSIPLKLSALPLLETLTEAILTSGGLADGEVGRGPRWRRRSLWPRQRGANQRAMNRPFFAISTVAGFFPFVFAVLALLAARLVRLGVGVQGAGNLGVFRQLSRLFEQGAFSGSDRQLWFVQFRSACQPLCSKRRRRLCFPAEPRHLRLFVFVLRVASRATRLFDFGTDHRDDGMVGDATFTGAIVVENVTKPKLALLHQELPPQTSLGKGKKLRKAPSY